MRVRLMESIQHIICLFLFVSVSILGSNYHNEAIPAKQPGYRIEAMAGAYEHFIVMACYWLANHYVAYQSMANQFYLSIHVKRARTLKDAIFGPGKWRKLRRTMPWTRIMSFLYWDSQGMEIQLFPNSYPGEKGVTAIYRFFDYR